MLLFDDEGYALFEKVLRDQAARGSKATFRDCIVEFARRSTGLRGSNGETLELKKPEFACPMLSTEKYGGRFKLSMAEFIEMLPGFFRAYKQYWRQEFEITGTRLFKQEYERKVDREEVQRMVKAIVRINAMSDGVDIAATMAVSAAKIMRVRLGLNALSVQVAHRMMDEVMFENMKHYQHKSALPTFRAFCHGCSRIDEDIPEFIPDVHKLNAAELFPKASQFVIEAQKKKMLKTVVWKSVGHVLLLELATMVLDFLVSDHHLVPTKKEAAVWKTDKLAYQLSTYTRPSRLHLWSFYSHRLIPFVPRPTRDVYVDKFLIDGSGERLKIHCCPFRNRGDVWVFKAGKGVRLGDKVHLKVLLNLDAFNEGETAMYVVSFPEAHPQHGKQLLQVSSATKLPWGRGFVQYRF